MNKGKIKRVWLNPTNHRDNGWLKYGIGRDFEYAEGYLVLADCNRTLDFNVGVDTLKDCKRTMKKLNKFISSLEDFKSQVEERQKELETYGRR